MGVVDHLQNGVKHYEQSAFKLKWTHLYPKMSFIDISLNVGDNQQQQPWNLNYK